MKILVINGPNINMLGIREKNIYGDKTYNDLISLIENHAREKDIKIECFQSNNEGDIVTKIQKAYGNTDGIVINPAAYTHTSVAILDAVKAVQIPTVEVHISDPDTREDFRKISFVRAACVKTIKGLGFAGDLKAIDYLEENYK